MHLNSLVMKFWWVIFYFKIKQIILSITKFGQMFLTFFSIIFEYVVNRLAICQTWLTQVHFLIVKTNVLLYNKTLNAQFRITNVIVHLNSYQVAPDEVAGLGRLDGTVVVVVQLFVETPDGLEAGFVVSVVVQLPVLGLHRILILVATHQGFPIFGVTKG